MNYHEPASIWTSFGIHNKEDHIKDFVIKGHFHKGVHEDVIKSYTTVEYLMAHSYFYWPLYDEALKKLLNIFEMAIKFRCTELNIPLTSQAKNGKRYDVKLSVLIEQLIKQGLPIELKSTLDWVRNLRNMLSHPDRNSFGGATFIQTFYSVLNLINQIFIPAQWYIEQQLESEAIKQKFASIKDSLLILPDEGQNILVFDAVPSLTFQLNGVWIHYCSFIPVFNNPKKIFAENFYANPITLILKNIELNSDGLTAIDYLTDKKINLSTTFKNENIDRLKEYKSEYIDKLNNGRFKYSSHIRSIIRQQLDEFIYTCCWKENDFR